MRVFDWEAGFTAYSATLDGDTLTEHQGADVERRSTLTRRPEWDGHPNASDYAMTDEFSAGEVEGVAVVWVDGLAYSLTDATTTDDLRVAIAAVTADQRAGLDGITEADAVEHARNTLALPGTPRALGAVQIDGDITEPSYRAYVAVLSATPEALAAALAR